MGNKCNKYLEPTGVVLGKSTRVLGKVTLTAEGVYDSTKEYDRISLVYDPNSYISYISKQNVPAGTALNNTEYWQPLNSAILGPGQTLNGILNMLNSLNLPSESSFLHYNEDNHNLEWVDVEELIEIINNSGMDLALNEPLKSINALNISATQAGQMLIYNGSQWKLDKINNIPQALGEPLKSIANLGTPSGKKIIMYDNGWKYADSSSIGLGDLLTHINTKNAPVPTSSGYLYYNGNSYSWNTGAGGDNVELGTLLTSLKNTQYPPANPSYLYYNGYGFTWRNSNVDVRWADIQNKPTTLSGYGITSSDPLIATLLNAIGNLLKEPLLSINSLNRNPSSTGMILVYREGGWVFEAKPSGGSTPGGDYDDSWIYDWKSRLENDTIPGLRSTLTSIQDELNSKLTATEAQIKGWIDQALRDYEWWKDNTVVDQIFHQSGWSDQLQAYLQTVGVLDSNGNLNVSTITQTINSIDLRVRAIEQSGSGGSGDESVIEILEAYCNQYIDEHEAIAQMGTMAAWLNENEDVIRWMTSGFKSSTARDGKQSFAEMYSIDKTALTSSIARIDASVSTNQTDIGELKTARTSMAAQITDIENMTGTSTIVSSVNAVDGKILDAKNEIISGLGGNLAAVVTESTLDSAMATILAEDASSASVAAISAGVSNGQSFIAMLADAIGIDATTTTFTGDVMANSFQTGGSGYGIIVLGEANDSFFNNSTSGGQYALHNKAYFYRDGSSMTLAIYNNYMWYKLDFNNLKLIGSGGNYTAELHYTIVYYAPDVDSITGVMLYKKSSDNKYYTAPNSSGALVSGTYYRRVGGTDAKYIYLNATTTVDVTEYVIAEYFNGSSVTSVGTEGSYYIGRINDNGKNIIASGNSITVDNETVYTGVVQASGSLQPAGNVTVFSYVPDLINPSL